MSKSTAMLSVLCIVLGSITLWQIPTNAAPRRVNAVVKWEHLAMTTDGPKLSTPEVSRKIIGLGNEGWQLVDVETYAENGTTTKAVYFFKREKSGE
ncbi:MAG: hypothetical protein AB8G99_17230 [Planctomycetaceae bacterium]